MKIQSKLRAKLLLLSVLGVLSLGNAFATTHHNAKAATEDAVATQAESVSSVNINEANAHALTELKGIGEKRAEAIVTYRKANGNFTSVDDLTKVKGISEKRLAKLKADNPGKLVL